MPKSTPQPALAAFLFASIVVCAGISVYSVLARHQTPGPFDPANQGFCDFQNGVYFPALAFADGVSPYSQR